TILVSEKQRPEDADIIEIWEGGRGRTSTLETMVRVFVRFWQKVLEPGQALGWQPRQLTTHRFRVALTRVELGSPDFNFHRLRRYPYSMVDSLVDQQLTVAYRLLPESPPPEGSLVMEGR